MGNQASRINFSDPVQSMGDLPSDSKPSMDQRLMQLERRLREQHDSHQQQLASFLAANAPLWEENTALRNAAPTLPHLDTIAHRLDVPLSRRNPIQSKSTNNFSPPSRHTRLRGGLLWAERTPSPVRAWTPCCERWMTSQRPHSSMPSSIKRLRHTCRCRNFRCTMDCRTPSTI